MPNVLVTLTGNINTVLTINLKSSEWAILHEDNLPPFSLLETKRPCDVYPDGIFPGGQNSDNHDEQMTRILRFPNYVEFSKVTLKDTKLNNNGERQLTSRFYEKRKLGFSSPDLKIKEGEIIGFNVNGDIYHISDAKKAYTIFYGLVYHSLVKDFKEFHKLKGMVASGICLQLTGGSEIFLNELAKILK